MNQKIFPFKFNKKSSESQEKINHSKKNYEHIFNDILNRKKIDNSDSKNITNESLENKNQLNKKNKIKYISKINNSNNNEPIKKNKDDFKSKSKILENNKKNIVSYMILNEIKKTKDKNISSYNDHNNFDINNDYMNKTNILTRNNYNKILNQHFEKKPIYIHQNSNSNCRKKNNKFLVPQNSQKSKKEDKQNKSVKKYKNINLTKNEIDKKNSKPFNVVKVMKKYELDFSVKNILLNSKTPNINSQKQSKVKKKKENKKYECEEKKEKKIPSYKIKNLIYKDLKKNNHFNYMNKIAITNDDLKENSINKNNINNYNNRHNKIKDLRINKSNLNININLTNFSEKAKKTNFIYDHNFNIESTNLLNNKHFSRQNTNDCHLPFYNHSSNKKLSNLNHIISKGIKVQSINIYLGEDNNDNNNNFNKYKNKFKNKDNGNFIFLSEKKLKSKQIDLEKKETQSEHDYEDFWSNRSMTNSCKSGFTASTRLRSLSKERDKIKLINKMRKKNEDDMERIGDKLLNIVNNFHKFNNYSKKNRKSDNRLNEIKNKYKL